MLSRSSTCARMYLTSRVAYTAFFCSATRRHSFARAHERRVRSCRPRHAKSQTKSHKPDECTCGKRDSRTLVVVIWLVGMDGAVSSSPLLSYRVANPRRAFAMMASLGSRARGTILCEVPEKLTSSSFLRCSSFLALICSSILA